jgi:CHAT domain-containing protein
MKLLVVIIIFLSFALQSQSPYIILNKAEKLFYEEEYEESERLLDSIISNYSEISPDSLSKIYYFKSQNQFYLHNYKNMLKYGLVAQNIADTSLDRNSLLYSYILYQTGFSFHYNEDIFTAENYYLRTLEIYKKHNLEGTIEYGQLLNTLAYVYQTMSRYNEALDYFMKSSDIIKHFEGDTSIAYALNLKGIGQVYYLRNDYVKAYEYLDKSINIVLNFHKDKILYLNELYYLKSLFNARTGNIVEALRLINKVKDLTENNQHIPKRTLVQTYLNFAYIYLLQNENQKASEIAQKARDIAAEYEGKETRFYTNSLSYLAKIEMRNENFQKAESLLKEAIEISENEKFTKDRKLSALYLAMSDIMMQKDNFDSAFVYINMALDYYSFAGSLNMNYNIALFKKALIYDITEQTLQANLLYKESIENMKEFYLYNSAILNDEERLSLLNNITGFINNYYSFLFRNKSNKVIIDYALSNSLFMKKILIKQNNNIKNYINKSNDTVLANLYYKWLYSKKKYIRLKNMPEELIVRNGENPVQTKTYADSLEREISKIVSAFSSYKPDTAISHNSYLNNIPKEFNAVDIVRFQYHNGVEFTDSVKYIAFIIKPSGATEPVFFDNGNELEQKYYKIYENAILNKAYDDYSYSHFWKPIQEKLNSSKLIISKDGVFNQISPDAIFNPTTQKYLIEEFEIYYTGNLIDFDINSSFDSNVKELTASLYGDPDFNIDGAAYEKIIEEKYLASVNIRGHSRDFLTSLPESSKEIKQIDTLLRKKGFKTNVYLQKNALEEQIKSENNPYILHIATHGDYIDPELKTNYNDEIKTNALKGSFLFFSGANKNFIDDYGYSVKYDDGILTTNEIENINLINTKLVVLSACKTGLGENVNGIGVLGLQSAFFKAGAKSIIMSLWNVQDAAAKELMTEFYKNLTNRPENIQRAFRQAKLTILKRYEYPYFWGVFEIISN